MIIQSITEKIGNTPLLLIPETVHQIQGVQIYAKLEYLNPFGSIKDRTALGIINGSGNATNIIESSSGNTAKALGILAGLQGKKFTTVTNRIKQREVEEMLYIIGVEIENLPPGSECPDPNDPNSPFRVIESIISKNPGKYHWTDQYTNEANPNIHFETTAAEIDADIGTPDYFFAGLGTTGSSKGITQYFSNKGKMESIGIITANGSYLPGIRNNREMGEVGLFEKNIYKSYVQVNEQDAIDKMLELIRKCGILVGPTTGATFHGMIEYLHTLNVESIQGKKIVFIACDRIESYVGYVKEKRPQLFEDKESKITIAPKPELGQAKFIKKGMLDESKQILIDMRSYQSYSLEHIDGSISFPFYKLQEYLKEGYLPFPKEKEVIFICSFGEESELMSKIANGLDYDTYSLEGGYLAL